jgi:hypothetical protein
MKLPRRMTALKFSRAISRTNANLKIQWLTIGKKYFSVTACIFIKNLPKNSGL